MGTESRLPAGRSRIYAVHSYMLIPNQILNRPAESRTLGFSGIQSHHCMVGYSQPCPFSTKGSAVPIASVQAFPSHLRHILLRRLLEDLFVVVAAEVVLLAFVSRFGRTRRIHIHVAHRTQGMRIGGNLLRGIDVV